MKPSQSDSLSRCATVSMLSLAVAGETYLRRA